MILRKNKCKQKSPVPNGAGDFYVVKLINKLTKKKEAVEEETKEIQKSDEVLLLEEIRDELKKKNN